MDTDEIAKIIGQTLVDLILITDLEISVDAIRQALITVREHGLYTVPDPSPAERMMPGIYLFLDYITHSQPR
ncbi:MAG: hypothetical protein ACU4EQ_09175 [Candidatus Nitrosoglobus sp.]